MTITDKDVDDAVLAMVEPSWRKVAFIVGRAAQHLGEEFAARTDAYQFVARRIETLVADGRLVSQGNLAKWRFSEIRLPRQTQGLSAR